MGEVHDGQSAGQASRARWLRLQNFLWLNDFDDRLADRILPRNGKIDHGHLVGRTT
jgi:hypothetical protein